MSFLTLDSNPSMEDSHTCPVCFRAFAQQEKMIIHLQQHSVKNSYLCCFCCTKYQTKSSLIHHYQAKHPGSDEICIPHERKGKSPGVVSEATILACRACDVTFSNARGFDIHRRSFHAVSLVEKVKKQKSGLKARKILQERQKRKVDLALVHQNGSHIQTRRAEFDACSSSSMNSPESADTVVSYKSQSPIGLSDLLLCKDCNNSFASRASLNNHKCRKICTFCGAELASESSLKKHIRLVHTGRVRCKLCGQIMPNIQQLYYHLRREHSEVKKCLKYLVVDNLQVKDAEQKKEHQCDICGKLFLKTSSLHKHLSVMHMRRHQCSTCCKIFVSFHLFNNHNKLEHDGCALSRVVLNKNVSTFSCRFCNKSFSQYFNKAEHEKTFHAKEYKKNRSREPMKEQSSVNSNDGPCSQNSIKKLKMPLLSAAGKFGSSSTKEQKSNWKQVSFLVENTIKNADAKVLRKNSRKVKKKRLNGRRFTFPNSTIHHVQFSSFKNKRKINKSFAVEVMCSVCFVFLPGLTALKAHKLVHEEQTRQQRGLETIEPLVLEGDELESDQIEEDGDAALGLQHNSDIQVVDPGISITSDEDDAKDDKHSAFCLLNKIPHFRSIHQLKRYVDCHEFKAQENCDDCTSLLTALGVFKPTSRSTPGKLKDLLTCPICFSEFKSKRGFSAHKKRTHPDAAEVCINCSQTFESPTALRAHEKKERNLLKKIQQLDFEFSQNVSTFIAKENENENLDIYELNYVDAEVDQVASERIESPVVESVEKRGILAPESPRLLSTTTPIGGEESLEDIPDPTGLLDSLMVKIEEVDAPAMTFCDVTPHRVPETPESEPQIDPLVSAVKEGKKIRLKMPRSVPLNTFPNQDSVSGPDIGAIHDSANRQMEAPVHGLKMVAARDIMPSEESGTVGLEKKFTQPHQLPNIKQKRPISPLVLKRTDGPVKAYKVKKQKLPSSTRRQKQLLENRSDELEANDLPQAIGNIEGTPSSPSMFLDPVSASQNEEGIPPIQLDISSTPQNGDSAIVPSVILDSEKGRHLREASVNTENATYRNEGLPSLLTMVIEKPPRNVGRSQENNGIPAQSQRKSNNEPPLVRYVDLDSNFDEGPELRGWNTAVSRLVQNSSVATQVSMHYGPRLNSRRLRLPTSLQNQIRIAANHPPYKTPMGVQTPIDVDNPRSRGRNLWQRLVPMKNNQQSLVQPQNNQRPQHVLRPQLVKQHGADTSTVGVLSNPAYRPQHFGQHGAETVVASVPSDPAQRPKPQLFGHHEAETLIAGGTSGPAQRSRPQFFRHHGSETHIGGMTSDPVQRPRPQLFRQHGAETLIVGGTSGPAQRPRPQLFGHHGAETLIGGVTSDPAQRQRPQLFRQHGAETLIVGGTSGPAQIPRPQLFGQHGAETHNTSATSGPTQRPRPQLLGQHRAETITSSVHMSDEPRAQLCVSDGYSNYGRFADCSRPHGPQNRSAFRPIGYQQHFLPWQQHPPPNYSESMGFFRAPSALHGARNPIAEPIYSANVGLPVSQSVVQVPRSYVPFPYNSDSGSINPPIFTASMQVGPPAASSLYPMNDRDNVGAYFMPSQMTQARPASTLQYPEANASSRWVSPAAGPQHQPNILCEAGRPPYLTNDLQGGAGSTAGPPFFLPQINGTQPSANNYDMSMTGGSPNYSVNSGRPTQAPSQFVRVVVLDPEMLVQEVAASRGSSESRELSEDSQQSNADTHITESGKDPENPASVSVIQEHACETIVSVPTATDSESTRVPQGFIGDASETVIEATPDSGLPMSNAEISSSNFDDMERSSAEGAGLNSGFKDSSCKYSNDDDDVVFIEVTKVPKTCFKKPGDKRVFVCEICEREFRDVVRLKFHMRDRH